VSQFDQAATHHLPETSDRTNTRALLACTAGQAQGRQRHVSKAIGSTQLSTGPSKGGIRFINT